ncbi:MAG: Peptide chain release factor 2 [Patescibacteria group bacterium]|jgi:peptide chain release factor 2|nr:Peptide chain release factor 2 [Patescibacteria group bacterium]
MKPIIKSLTSLLESVNMAIKQLDIQSDKTKLTTLEDSIAEPDFWNDSSNAEKVSREASELKRYINSWEKLQSDLQTTLDLAQLESDDSGKNDFENILQELTSRADSMLVAVKLSEEFDKNPAIVQISAGVGGTDAQDWAQMLQQMYIKYANTSGMSVEVLDTSFGEEAGIKSTTMRITGPFAYGLLKCEKGVHRLVRLSPFNSDNLRQTSFALVDVIPQIDDKSVHINEKDLRIDVYRAGGHGGQSVNTTDSAVRITHLPTGTTVSIQNERSQLKNKATALSILAARLSELARAQKLDDIEKLRGQVKSADWGAQIRSYVLHPYTKVKDHRTNFETSDTSGVLNGDIQPFIEAYLEQNISK